MKRRRTVIENFRAVLQNKSFRWRDLLSTNDRGYAPWRSVEAIPEWGLVRFNNKGEHEVILSPENCSSYLLWDSPLASKWNYSTDDCFDE